MSDFKSGLKKVTPVRASTFSEAYKASRERSVEIKRQIKEVERKVKQVDKRLAGIEKRIARIEKIMTDKVEIQSTLEFAGIDRTLVGLGMQLAKLEEALLPASGSPDDGESA